MGVLLIYVGISIKNYMPHHSISWWNLWDAERSSMPTPAPGSYLPPCGRPGAWGDMGGAWRLADVQGRSMLLALICMVHGTIIGVSHPPTRFVARWRLEGTRMYY
jgi:hypothetical protein